ncbi:MAG: hypothetical protein ACI82F_003089, partial [Planctomycetota bacterium]
QLRGEPDALPGNLWRPTEKLLFFNGLLADQWDLLDEFFSAAIDQACVRRLAPGGPGTVTPVPPYNRCVPHGLLL